MLLQTLESYANLLDKFERYLFFHVYLDTHTSIHVSIRNMYTQLKEKENSKIQKTLELAH